MINTELSQAEAAQYSLSMPSKEKYLFAKQHGLDYSQVFLVDGVTFAIRKEKI